MKVVDIEKTHLRVHGNFRGCLCFPIKAIDVWKKGPDGQSVRVSIKRTAELQKVDCTQCLMLWDAWLIWISTNPPRPSRDQIADLYSRMLEETK